MALSPEDIRAKFREGVEQGKKWMVHYCDIDKADADQIEYGDDSDSLANKLEELGKQDSVIVMGDYDLSVDMDRQISAHAD